MSRARAFVGAVLLSVAAAPAQVSSPPAANSESPRPGQSFSVESLDLRMVWLPSGDFELGSPAHEASRGADEGPQTRVSITRGFWIGAYEVTQAQWRAVMGTDTSRFRAPKLPVEQVSWNDAMEFARRVDSRERQAGRIPEGYAFTLPTEAQWEYAAKAGGKGAFTGNVDDAAWHDQNSGGTTHPVGTKKPNPWGLYDMLGNVWEWCSDWYAPYPGGTARNYAGPAAGFAKASRGGSWWAGPRGARPANRYRDMPQNGNDDLGLRLALVPGESPTAYVPLTKITGTVSLAGTDSMAPMVQRWIDVFRAHQPGISLTLASGPPPSAAAALVDRSATLAYTGRTLWASEVSAIVAARAHSPQSFRVGAGAYMDRNKTHTMAVFVHRDNPLRRLSMEYLRRAFAVPEAHATWGDLGAKGAWAPRSVRPIVAKLATGATNHVRQTGLLGADWSSRVRQFSTDEEAIAALEQDPAALCIAGLPFGTSMVRALSLSEQDTGPYYPPTLEDVASRRYPLARLLYVHAVTSAAAPLSPAAAEFLRFVLSHDGQRITIESGYLPLTAEILRAELVRLP
jgi:formylglycine-generating enzyme required for sulfatase activity/ABC-type phosphate transport system substrate-binding protein